MLKSAARTFSTQENSSLSQDIQCTIRHFPAKRAFDIFFSLAALIILFPLLFLIAAAIKLTSGGKVFYAHRRIGRGGKLFYCYKFRTMYPDADQRLDAILNSDPAKKREWESRQKLTNDPRVTAVGAFLRKASLDELPQFFNVLKGDMSVVGPRPVVEQEIADHFGLKAAKIFSIRPGITGPWQVSGRSDTSYSTRVTLDEKYVDSQSMMLDIKLIAKTIPTILSSRGAY